MILVRIRPKGAKTSTITMHPKVTVLAGIDGEARRRLADDLAAVLRGAGAAGVEIDVEVDGKPRPLTPQLANELGLANGSPAAAVFATDLPGAKTATAEPEPEPEPEDPGPATAAVDEQRAKLRQAEDELKTATDKLAGLGAPNSENRELTERIATLEEALKAAQASAAKAKRELAEARAAGDADAAAKAAADAEAKAARDALGREQADLGRARAELVVRMVEMGDPGDPAPVEQALDGLRRLQQVKPKPSPQAADVADRWAAIVAKLAALPQPPQPPEWLVTPALAALHEAKEALAQAESGPGTVAVDQTKVDALDRAHREVLEAEQKAMNKGSRSNRRRLEAAHAQEQTALAALGVSTYGEYLQRIAPMTEGGGSPSEDRIRHARAALADAEAVWEELHGGQASPEWTAAKEEQAGIRTEAFALLSREVDDDDIEAALRGHLEVVVDTAWAEQELVQALGRAGASVDEDDDIEEAAVRWLAESPEQRERRAALEVELTEIDQRLEALEAELAEHGDVAVAAPSNDVDEFAGLAAAASKAEAAERTAEAELTEARQRLAAVDAAGAAAAAAQGEVDTRTKAVDEQRAKLTEAEEALAAVRRRIDEAAAAKKTTSDAGTANGGVDLAGVVAMEAELYVLARVAGLRSAPAGPLPLVFDAAAVAGLAPAAAGRMLGLLERTAATVQVVVLGDDGEVGEWAKRLGSSGAAVHSVRL